MDDMTTMNGRIEVDGQREDELDEMVLHVQRHARECYGKSGWDSIVECWTYDEIFNELAKTRVRTKAGAIKILHRHALVHARYMREASPLSHW